MENRVLDDLLGKPSESIFHAIPLPDFFKGVKLISPIDFVQGRGNPVVCQLVRTE